MRPDSHINDGMSAKVVRTDRISVGDRAITGEGNAMYRRFVMTMAVLAATLSACSTRSISNSGYQADGYYGSNNAFYRGEIDELDLLVPEQQKASFQGDIDAALAHNETISAELGQPLLVVQSGAIVPDEAMTDALKDHFAVAPFSGLPTSQTYAYNGAANEGRTGSYGERLRLAAARGGYHRVLIYWGALEALTTRGVTKTISWVPIVGMVIPDESQQMRIRLKAAVLDVATGDWRMILPPSVESSAISASIDRATSDQEQVTELKAAGYAKLAQMIVEGATKAASAP